MKCYVILTFALGCVCAIACAPDEMQETPYVQPSADAPARWNVNINRVTNGVFRTYSPRCFDYEQGMRVGHTVEFRNYMPSVPANVTSIAGPETLYSPNLVRPYNYVAPDCEPGQPGCSTEGYSYWRYTFDTPGVYDWIDTNAGEPGRKVVDPYYGTVTFVGIDPSTPFGTICVQERDGSLCEGVCCMSDADCTSGNRCFRTEVDALGRCLTPSG